MKKLLLALLLSLAAVVPAAAQDTRATPTYCNKFFQVNQGAVALTKIVSGIANQSIQICGIALSGGAAASTFSASYGTGTNCATGTVTLYPLVNVPINGAYVDRSPFVGENIPSVNASGVANDFCIVTTGTGPLSIMVYYAQF